MVEFNSDGSIKLPGGFAREKQAEKDRMSNSRCAIVKKEIVSAWAPKKCALHIRVSDRLPDTAIIEQSHLIYREKSETQMKLTKIDQKEVKIEISNEFRRCSDCQAFISMIQDRLDGNLILDKGNCTFENKAREFTDLDYFD